MFVTGHMKAWTNMSLVLVFIAFIIFIILVICLEYYYYVYCYNYCYCYAYLCFLWLQWFTSFKIYFHFHFSYICFVLIPHPRESVFKMFSCHQNNSHTHIGIVPFIRFLVCRFAQATFFVIKLAPSKKHIYIFTEEVRWFSG